MQILFYILIGIFCWWLFGAICFICQFFLSKEEELKVEDIVGSCGMSFFGPFILIVIVAMYVEDNKDKVIFRKKKKE